jgi:hypothetical protein
VTLVEFLLARVAEDEEEARRASMEGANWRATTKYGSVWSDDPEADPAMPVVYDEGRPLTEQAAHIARWDPARVLAECRAWRAVIELHRLHSPPYVRGSCPTLLALAQLFKDHPDFAPSWLQD